MTRGDAARSAAAPPTTPVQRGLALALTVHVLARGVQLLVLSVMARTAGQEPLSRLSVWDGGWYLRIAADGYARTLDLRAEDTGSLAFYPVYPLLIRGVSAGTGLSPDVAGVLLTETAAVAAAVGIYFLAARLYSPRVGVALVLLWSAQPLSVVLSMVYTEALFTALAAWTLLALHRQRWAAAGLLAAVAALTRSSGVVLSLVVAAYAGWCWWQRRDRRAAPLLAGTVALAGIPAWWAWVGWHTGVPTAWFVVQRTFWESQWDWGHDTVALGRDLFTQAVRYSGDALLVALLAYALIGAGVVLLVALVYRRTWWPLLLYAAGLLALTIGTAGYFNSKPRFFVPIFPLLIPLAAALARAGRPTRIVVGVSVVLASAWVGAYLVVVWAYTI